MRPPAAVLMQARPGHRSKRRSRRRRQGEPHMESRWTVAQGVPAPGLQAGSARVVKVARPDTGQAVTIQLDGAVRLDLSGIANDAITLVRVGDRLVILFDNQSTITLQPFYGADGQPFADITVELGPDRIVT